MQKLPKGEETLPIAEVGGRFLTFSELGRLPELITVSNQLLIKRMEERVAQGRVPTIYRLEYELTPAQQVEHMKLGDDIGKELLEAERKLLEHEIRIMRE